MDINDELRNLDASLKGDYWICRCPTCGRREAYIYVDDVKKAKTNKGFRIPIRCNRSNKCGATNYLNSVDIGKIPEVKEKDIIGVSSEGIERIENLAYFNDLIVGYDISWRGISNKTLKENGIIYYPRGFQSFIKNAPKGAFADKFFIKKCYQNRNIMIPIKDYDGKCVRLLLRNTERPVDDDLKEIGMRLVGKSSEIWNRKDLIDPGMPLIWVTEGVPDGLSIKEAAPETGVVSIPGVRKYRQLIKEIENHMEICKKKTFILCFDNDTAGICYEKKLIERLEELDISWIKFTPSNFKDMNEYLQEDTAGFKKEIKKIIRSHMLQETTDKIVHKLIFGKEESHGKQIKLWRKGSAGVHQT